MLGIREWRKSPRLMVAVSLSEVATLDLDDEPAAQLLVCGLMSCALARLSAEWFASLVHTFFRESLSTQSEVI